MHTRTLMSTLLVLLPPRPRPAPGGEAVSAPQRPPTQRWRFVLTLNGVSVAQSGLAAGSELPAADTLVVVPHERDLAWHEVTVPPAPPARMEAALRGVLEEALADEAAAVHLALAPQAQRGARAWVAAIDRTWLQRCVEAVAEQGRVVDRVSPAVSPDLAAHGHFQARDANADANADEGMSAVSAATDRAEDLMLTWCDEQGVVCTPVQGSVARAWVRAAAQQPRRFTADPGVAAAAEHWLGHPVQVLDPAERALAAARSPWDLMQGELRATPRLLSRWRSLKAWRTPAWKPVRLGLAALLAVQVLGLNAAAWREHRALHELQQAQRQLLQSTYPQVKVVLDAPLQMQRETDLARARSGVVGRHDFEALMGVISAAWPADAPPGALSSLSYDSSALTVTVSGWSASQQQALAASVQAQGWRAEVGPRGVVVRAATGTPP